jgi:hypothetical protein
MFRTRTLTGAGVIATVILVLVFGNQAVTEWVSRHYPDPNSDGWSWFLHKLTWPAWAFSSGNARGLLVADLRALFLILFVALVLSLAGKALSGGGGAFLLGWAALIFASALSGFITAWVAQDASFIGSLTAAQEGSGYGLFVGWIVGIATMSAKGKPAAATA